MNRFQLILGKPANVSPTTDIERDSNSLNFYDAGIVNSNNHDSDTNKINFMCQPMKELQQNMEKIIFKGNDDDNNTKNRARKNAAKKLMKGISDKFDQMGQEINQEFHQMRKDLFEEIRSKTNERRSEQEPAREKCDNTSNSVADIYISTINSDKRLAVDGDELVMNEIKMKAELMKSNFSKIIRNMSDTNKEKVQSLKHNMSERIKKQTDFMQTLPSSSSSNVATTTKTLNMKIPTITIPAVSIPSITVPNITMPSSSKENNMLRQLKRKLQQRQKANVISNSKSSYDSKEDTTLDFFQDESYGVVRDEINCHVYSEIEPLEETVFAIDLAKYSTSWEESSGDHFTIGDEEDELI